MAKLVHNMSGYALVCALAETFTMGVKAGVEPLALWQAVRQGAAGRRFTFDALIDQFLPGTYDPPAFALKLAHKDVAVANALGRELGVPMRMRDLARRDDGSARARMGQPRFARGDAAAAGTRGCRDRGGSRAVARGARACRPQRRREACLMRFAVQARSVRSVGRNKRSALRHARGKADALAPCRHAE